MIIMLSPYARIYKSWNNVVTADAYGWLGDEDSNLD